MAEYSKALILFQSWCQINEIANVISESGDFAAYACAFPPSAHIEIESALAVQVLIADFVTTFRQQGSIAVELEQCRSAPRGAEIPCERHRRQRTEHCSDVS